MEAISDLSERLRSEPEKNQLQLISQIADMGEIGCDTLMEWMMSRRNEKVNLALGKAYQTLYQTNNSKTAKFLQTYFQNGVVALESERNIDYRPLQKLLAQQDFQEADLLTIQKLCELAGEAAIQRKWLYFTEVDSFPFADLQTLDRLWRIHSEGKFGFSVQRKIWLSVGKDFSQLWYKIGWRKDNSWTRYPNGFTWDLSAPKGHLPLSNQLRGVRVIAALFAHPAWSETSK